MKNALAISLGASVVIGSLYFLKSKFINEDFRDSVSEDFDETYETVSDLPQTSRFLVLLGGSFNNSDLQNEISTAFTKVTGLDVAIRVIVSKPTSIGVLSCWTVSSIDIPDSPGVDGEFTLRSMNPYLSSKVRILSVISVPRDLDAAFLCEGTCFELLLPSPLVCPLTDNDDWWESVHPSKSTSSSPSSSSAMESRQSLLSKVKVDAEDLNVTLVRRFLANFKGRRLNPAVLIDPSQYPPPPLSPTCTIYNCSLDKILMASGQVAWRIVVQGCHHLNDKWVRLIGGLAVSVSLHLLPPSICEQILLPRHQNFASSSFSPPRNRLLTSTSSGAQVPWFGELPVLPPLSTLLSVQHHPSIPLPPDVDFEDKPSAFISHAGALDAILKLRSEIFSKMALTSLPLLRKWILTLLFAALAKGHRLNFNYKTGLANPLEAEELQRAMPVEGDPKFDALIDLLLPNRMTSNSSQPVRGQGLLDFHLKMVAADVDKDVVVLPSGHENIEGGETETGYLPVHPGRVDGDSSFLLLGETAFVTPQRSEKDAAEEGEDDDDDDVLVMDDHALLRVTEYVSLLSPDQKKMKEGLDEREREERKRRRRMRDKKRRESKKTDDSNWWVEGSQQQVGDEVMRRNGIEEDDLSDFESSFESEFSNSGDETSSSSSSSAQVDGLYGGDRAAKKEAAFFFSLLRCKGFPSRLTGKNTEV
eukprot:GDKJ01005096.1.p1 GENE.GDKJ01005096.1~~GDKJ01005096.1.p1  ORF type:complete len:701 (-),score=186.86 GDKJ01005096.1:66-2168(-)